MREYEGKVIIDGQLVPRFWDRCVLRGERGPYEQRDVLVEFQGMAYIFYIGHRRVSSIDEYLSGFERPERIPYEGDVENFDLDKVAKGLPLAEGWRRWALWLAYTNANETETKESKRQGTYDPEWEEMGSDPRFVPWLIRHGLMEQEEQPC